MSTESKLKLLLPEWLIFFYFLEIIFLQVRSFYAIIKHRKNYKKIKKTSKKFKKTIDILKYMRYNNKAVENNI